MTEMRDRRSNYVLHIANSNAAITQHPTLDHALKHAAYVGAQENRQNAVRARVTHPEGHTTETNVHPMNEAEVAAHGASVKTGNYRLAK